MVAVRRVELVLVGARAGMTVTFGGRRYVNGVFSAEVREDQIEHLIRAGERMDGAFPRGSRALAEAEARLDGRADSQEGTAAQDRRLHDLSGAVHVRPSNPAAEGAGVFGPRVDGAAGSALRVCAAGDRYEDTRIHREASGRCGEGLAAEGDWTAVERKIIAAVKALDPEDDDAWTADGRPKLSAVEAIYGAAGLTREDIDSVLPGWDRDAALAAALEALA